MLVPTSVNLGLSIWGLSHGPARYARPSINATNLPLSLFVFYSLEIGSLSLGFGALSCYLALHPGGTELSLVSWYLLLYNTFYNGSMREADQLDFIKCAFDHLAAYFQVRQLSGVTMQIALRVPQPTI